MKILIDEDMAERLAELMPEHDVRHVRAMGWKGTYNGKLLQLTADHEFAAFVTVDKNMPYQQNMAGRPFALLVLDVHPTTFANQAACVPALQIQLDSIAPGEVYVIEGPHPKRRKD